MVRASTLPLRALALQYGADFCYTEELVDKSLLQTVRVENTELGTIDYIKQYSNQQQHQQPTATTACDTDAVAANSSGSTTLGSHKKKKKQSNNHNHSTRAPALLLRIDPVLERHRLVCQLGTGDAETAVRAALHVHRDVSAIDINMGCPKPFSVGGGMGSALLQDPERACRIVTSLVSQLVNLGDNNHTRMPVSAKIRLLPGGIQPTVDFVTGLVNAGVTAVTIHGRYVGTPEPTAADWDVLREVTVLCKSKFPTTSILVNGDFYTRHEFTEFQQSTGADGVVLARPALYNTSIFVKPNSRTGTMSDTTTTTPPLYSYDSPLLRDPSIVVQDYLRHAVRYQANYKNIKYVVCEMRNLRRHPTDRVPYLAAASKSRMLVQPSSMMPTIGQVCNCHSLSDICQLWNVDSAAAVEPQQQHKRPITHDLAGEHTYSDAYLLQPSVVSETATSGKRARVECAASPTVSSERSM